MLSYRVFSILVIGIGLSSPWLVRDWLSSGTAGKLRIHSSTSSTEASRGEPTSDESSPDRDSSRSLSSIAHPDRRLIEGFFGESGVAPKAVIPETPRSRAITASATLKLEPELEKLGFRCGDSVVLRLFKEEGELEIWMQPDSESLYSLFKIVRLTASSGRLGPKTHEGDGQTPEGFYSILAKNLRPKTQHYLGLDLGYPNERDRQLNRTGSDLMLHAGKSAAGGYAISQDAMEELYTLCDAALRRASPEIPVQIYPFRLTDRRMDRTLTQGSAWLEEWTNLKEGYDFFENVRQPPRIDVVDGVYHFSIEQKKM